METKTCPQCGEELVEGTEHECMEEQALPDESSEEEE